MLGRNRFGDRAARGDRVAADELVSTVHHHLGRVYGFEIEDLSVSLLAACRGARREPIAPTEPVPVIDMVPECNDLCARDRLRVAERLEERVGRRTTRTSFRGEQLDEDR